MANTSSRTLRLLSLLQSHRSWSGAELAERLAVSIRTLRRDVERLRELPPLVLDDDEAVALALGLLSASQSSVAGMAEASVQALTKVVHVMPKRLRRRIDALQATIEPVGWGSPPTTVDSGALTTVAQACRDTERIEFRYTTAADVETDRRVDPFRLVSLARRWYLLGYDLDRHDWRIFRLDRLSGPRSTGLRFAPRSLPATDAAAFVRARLATSWGQPSIIATVRAPAQLVESRIGRWATVRADSDDVCTVSMNADGFEWAALALAMTGAEFQVVEPVAFREYLADWGGRIGRAVSA
jgi:predicted DNA-binding transcriptional regulator YafY